MGLIGITGQVNRIEDRYTLGEEFSGLTGAFDLLNGAVGQPVARKKRRWTERKDSSWP